MTPSRPENDARNSSIGDPREESASVGSGGGVSPRSCSKTSTASPLLRSYSKLNGFDCTTASSAGMRLMQKFGTHMLMRRKRLPLPGGVDSLTSGTGKGGGESPIESVRSLMETVIGELERAEALVLAPAAAGRTDFLLRNSIALEGRRFC